MDDSIKVIFRFRYEPPGTEQSGWEISSDIKALQLGQGKNPDRKFEFDAILGPSVTQEAVYESHSKGAIDIFMKGFNSTIFAYGQTGSGKTYSMIGPEEVVDQLVKNCKDIPESVAVNFGIIPRSILTIFTMINDGVEKGVQYQLKCSYLEVYNETIQDILSTPVNANLKIREFPGGQGMQVIGQEERSITTPEQVFECLTIGQKNRAVSATSANSRSSRSHTVFQLLIEQKTTDGVVKTSKLNLVDLAGSEKLTKAQTTGQQLEETKKINQSLTCLGICIMALSDKKKAHVPFRDSKLTMILKESLGGNSKTLMFCTGSVLVMNEEETVSSLRFAQRAKKIVNKAKNNVKRSVAELEALIESLKKEVARLRALLKKQGFAVTNNSELDGEMEGVEEPQVEDNQTLQADEDIQIKLTELLSIHDLMKLEKDEEIDNLKRKLEKVNLNEEKAIEVEKLNSQLMESEKQVEKEKIKYETNNFQLQTQLTEFREKYIVAEEERQKAENQKKVVSQSVKLLTNQVEEKEQQNQTLQQQIVEIHLEGKKNVVQTQNNQVSVDNSQELAQLKDKYEKELNKINDDRTRIKKDRDDLEAKNEDLEEELKKLRKQVQQQETQITKTSDELIQNHSQMRIQDSQNEKNAQKLNDSLKQLTELKKQVQRMSKDGAQENQIITKKVVLNQGLFGQHTLRRTNNSLIQKAIEEAERAQQVFDDLNKPKEEKKDMQQ